MTAEALVKLMTFQVALLGTDGWVLASDTCIFDPYPTAVGSNESPMVIGVRSTGTKIVYRPEIGVIYACSGGSNLSYETGANLERRLKAAISPEGRYAALDESEKEAISRYSQEVDGSLIVIFLTDPIECWTISIRGVPVRRSLVAYGGGGNLAMYFPNRLYIERNRPVADLKLLAAYAVLEANFFNPSVVEGLEMYWSERGNVHHATESELRDITEQSADIRARIDALFISRSKNLG